MTHVALAVAERHFRGYLRDLQERDVPVPALRDVYFDHWPGHQSYRATAQFVPARTGPALFEFDPPSVEIPPPEELVTWHLDERDLATERRGIRRERYPEYCRRIWDGLCGEVPILQELDQLYRTIAEIGARAIDPPLCLHGGRHQHRINELLRLLEEWRQAWMPRPEMDAGFLVPPMQRRAPEPVRAAPPSNDRLIVYRDQIVREFLRESFFTPYMNSVAVTDEAAEQRAKELLVDWLTPAQRAQFEREKHFDVIGSRGNRYRILPMRNSNVVRIEADGKESRWCFVPIGIHAVGDIMLAQKIALENFEDEAMAKANAVG